MFNIIVGAGAVGAGAASCYGSGSGSDQKMRLLAAPAPQHWLFIDKSTKYHSSRAKNDSYFFAGSIFMIISENS
jgi:hypothetical protein